MYGKDIRELNIYQKTANGSHFLIWTKADNQSNVWHRGNVDLPGIGAYEIIVEGVCRQSKGDIAIDDIEYYTGPCVGALIETCNFEKDWCNWTPMEDEFLEWRLLNKLSDLPIEDHTTSSANGYVAYARAENATGRPGLLSPKLHTEVQSCLTIWYYIYGNSNSIMLFNIYHVDKDENETLLVSLDGKDLSHGVWNKHLVDIRYTGNYSLLLEANFTKASIGGIAVDDLSIIDKPCPGEQYFSQSCMNIYKNFRIEGCPSIKLGENLSILVNTSGNYIDKCENIFESLLSIIKDQCRRINQYCDVPQLQEHISMKSCFMNTKPLLVEYMCIDKAISTQQTTSTIEHDGDTSISTHKITSTSEQDEMVSESSNQRSDSSQTIGIYVGATCGIGFIVGLTILIWCLVRKSQLVDRKFANQDNGTLLNDYTGHQALPEGSLELSNNGYSEVHIENDSNQDFKTKPQNSINALHEPKYSKNNKFGNNQNKDGPTNQDFTSSKVNTSPQYHRTTTQGLSDNNEYALVAPKEEIVFDKKRNVDCVGDYAVLDPSETGFNRSKCNFGTKTECDTAEPINPNQIEPNFHDHYYLTQNGTYDTSHYIQHKEVDTNVYSHAVDNVYDMSSHGRRDAESDNTYDHFFGQETEDNYNVVKRS